ncbi:MAG: histidine kinase dimerization/phosphoacceptor domain -containing protein [Clostridia bacterium]|jgi:hypothetical protein
MEKTLRHEQEGILGSLLRFMAVAGLIAWIPSVWASLLHGYFIIATVDTLGYGLILVAAYSKRFGFNAKLAVPVAVSILIGAVVLFYTGPLGAGYLWLVTAVVLSALFGRTLVVVLSIGVSALVMIIWAVALALGFDGKGSDPLTVGIIGSNLLLICPALAIVIRLLVDRLGASILESRGYADRLAVELAETKKIKQDLESSIEVKEFLLKELHHRVRNNMQVVQSLLTMNDCSGGMEVAARRVGALAMANDLSLTGRNAPKVEVDALFRSLVYQRVALSDDHSPQTRIVLDDSTGGQARIVDPQLAGLLAIVSSDIIYATSTTGIGMAISLGTGTGCMYADFRFTNASSTAVHDAVLSSVMESGLVTGADPDIRIEPLPAALDQEPGLRLTFQAIPGQPA